MSEQAYFDRLDVDRFVPTEHVSGAWEESQQHIGPSLGLLAHVVEGEVARRRDDLLIGRVSYDIFGVVPMDPVEVAVEVVRPGRTIELVEVRLLHGGRTIVSGRAWLLQRQETADVAGTPPAVMPGPQDLTSWDPTTIWPGGFLASAEVRRRQVEPGRAQYWVRPRVRLVAGEPVLATARMLGVLDISNGMTVRRDPRDVLFPNVDLTAHLVREPVGEWVGFDTAVTFSADGRGLTTSAIHDETGLVGQSSQALTVRPRPAR